MNILAVAGGGLVAAMLAMVIKQHKPEFAVYISLISGVLILAAVIAVIRPVIDMVTGLTETVGLDSVYAEVLLKSLAVCYITQLASDTCRDAGESAIASKLELAGKIAVTVIALPLFRSLVNTVMSLIA